MCRNSWLKKVIALLILSGICFGVYGIGVKLGQTQQLRVLSDRNPTCKAIVQALSNSEWEVAGILVSSAVKEKSLKKNDVKFLVHCFSKSPFADAWAATNAILALPKTGLSFEILFPIALYRETHTNQMIEKDGLYIPEERFGRELQLDPETEMFFIHLGSHHVKPLGKGRYKLVTKTVQYDRQHPQVYARALTFVDIKKEIEAMRFLKDKEGLLSPVAFLEHQEPGTNCKMMAIVTPICNRGSLQSLLDDATIRLSFGEKLKIAQNIITGLTSMHMSGYIHRDLGARNYFVTLDKSSFGNRTINCFIADFGRARLTDEVEAASVQGNPSYYAPEGVFVEKMKGSMYYATDLFAVGCVFWQLYFGALPPWSSKSKFTSPEEKEKQHQTLMENLIKGRNRASMIVEKLSLSEQSQAECTFLKAIIKMTDPDPSLRGTAKEIRDIICSLNEVHT